MSDEMTVWREPQWLRVHQRDGVPIGAEFLRDPTIEEWSEFTSSLLRFCRGLQWVVGDLLLGGEARYGEAYSQVLTNVEYSDQTLKSCQWVAHRFGMVRRRTIPSWSHHKEVSGMESAEADALLDRAASEDLSTRDLRRIVAEAKQANAPPAPPVKPFNSLVEAEAVESWLRARRQSWPAQERRHFAALLRNVADLIDHDAAASQEGSP